MNKSLILRVATMVTLGMAQCVGYTGNTAHAADQQSVDELRNTLISVLEALIQKGVLTREQAADIVANAQARTRQAAEAEASKKAAQEREEKDAVRVTFVPENIQQDISKQVADQVKPDVVKQVVEEAKTQGWAVPGALPEWAKMLTLYGDVRFRAEQTNYGKSNAEFTYVNFNVINTKGTTTVVNSNDGFFLNTTQDRLRTLSRLRLGVSAKLGESFRADVRLTSGNGRTVGSTNQTLGDYNGRGGINLDKIVLIWNPISRYATQELELQLGRFDSPYYNTSELVWDADLTFEGVAVTYAYDAWGHIPNKVERGLFVTVGAMPVQEVELSTRDKWLYGAQIGTEMPFGHAVNFKAAAAYYVYSHITGTRNAENSYDMDFTAPKYFQKGNTVFNIRSSTDSAATLLALASNYKLLDLNASLSFALFGHKRLTMSGEYVSNRGFNEADVLARFTSGAPGGATFPGKHTKGYNYGISLGDGSLHAPWAWRVGADYRKLDADAVVDAFTDSDFHGGGTDAKGYILSGELGLSRNVSMKARYMSSRAIIYPTLDIDTLQLDLNGRF